MQLQLATRRQTQLYQMVLKMLQVQI